MDKLFLQLSVIAVLLTSGCVATVPKYSPPLMSGTPTNEVVLPENFEVVWKRLVKNLSADFFVINNIEKASRLINISFSANQPSCKAPILCTTL